ncbi:MAG: hypothetical protein II728_02725, partial [Bacteroidaceae bacterium]|nr:hypothetical protein [Bacteroidaceae bacterium]
MTNNLLLQVCRIQTIKNRASFFDHYEHYLQKKSDFHIRETRLSYYDISFKLLHVLEAITVCNLRC